MSCWRELKKMKNNNKTSINNSYNYNSWLILCCRTTKHLEIISWIIFWPTQNVCILSISRPVILPISAMLLCLDRAGWGTPLPLHGVVLGSRSASGTVFLQKKHYLFMENGDHEATWCGWKRCSIPSICKVSIREYQGISIFITTELNQSFVYWTTLALQVEHCCEQNWNVFIKEMTIQTFLPQQVGCSALNGHYTEQHSAVHNTTKPRQQVHYLMVRHSGMQRSRY